MGKLVFQIIVLAFLHNIVYCQKLYSPAVEKVLSISKGNRIELENAIKHFSNSRDSVKLKALLFLIENMDIHFSQTYHWEDNNAKKINYNELDYTNFTTSVIAFDSLKNATVKIHPVIDNTKVKLYLDQFV